jgi:mRNA interferase RelE/StbE
LKPQITNEARIVFTETAANDLREFKKTAPSIVPLLLKKLLLIQRSPFAGEALLGGLIGYRKLSVGNRHWRIVWRVINDESNSPVVEIAEVWAIGARANSEVYDEVRKRIEHLGETPQTLAIRSIIERLGRSSTEFQHEHDQPDTSDPVPPWLVDRLEQQIGMDPSTIAMLSGEAAMKIWEDHITKPSQDREPPQR